MIDPTEILPPWPEGAPWRLSKSAPGFDHGGGYYSTEAFLLKKKAQLGSQSLSETSRLVRLEFAGEVTNHFLGLVGLRAEPCKEGLIQAVCIHGRHFEDAVAQTPWIRCSVAALARSVVPIASQGPDYDCSHSEPSMPFSVFVSVPPLEAEAGSLRFGESLIHETMHLQLSLFEMTTPVISPEGEDILSFSPWRSEYRPVRGVLHGLYVFFIISHWYSALVKQGKLSTVEQVFCKKRISGIGDEIESVRRTGLREGLTETGIELVEGIYSSVAAKAEKC